MQVPKVIKAPDRGPKLELMISEPPVGTDHPPVPESQQEVETSSTQDHDTFSSDTAMGKGETVMIGVKQGRSGK